MYVAAIILSKIIKYFIIKKTQPAVSWICDPDHFLIKVIQPGHVLIGNPKYTKLVIWKIAARLIVTFEPISSCEWPLS